MKEHHLGPNGAIMTSLNLFATKFDQVISLLEKRADGDPSTLGAAPIEGSISSIASEHQENSKLLDYIVVDTPGQIEAFTWSASGSIISESLASTFPTVLAFVVDTPRCSASPNTFMSNMLYACSMLYRTRLPLVVVFNKTDVVPHTFATEWMTNYESFQEALDEHSTESGYYGSLTRSLSLVLDEFYSTLRYVGVSALTGDGIPDFWAAVDAAACDFYTDYIPDLKVRIAEQYAKKRARERQNMDRLTRDMKEAKIIQEK
jgi:translation initiation factor IF-2